MGGGRRPRHRVGLEAHKQTPARTYQETLRAALTSAMSTYRSQQPEALAHGGAATRAHACV